MRMSSVAVAPIPMKLVTLAQRQAQVRKSIRSAAAAGAKLVCFPEYVDVQRTHEAVTLPDRPHKRLAARFPEGAFAELIRAEAARGRIGVLYGQCAWSGRKLLNLTVSVDSRGKVLGTYAKTHLAPDEGPEGGIAAGGRIAPLPTDLGPAGVITCYEVHFPELARTQVARGARFLVVPTAGNSDAFFTLARARAIENHAPLIFSSYSFERGSKSTGCGAGIVDGFGRVLAKTVYGAKVLSAEIDLDPPVRSPVWHGRWPKVNLRTFTWKRRRPALYAR
ncbi:MAG: carbon-nitrogen hydrolase family protein [Planctomycetes bacterium]|nr:carbon-nitrogen hydrolase family protein [Planctomycetota bacterium]